jgi:hypothetical protein
MPNNTPVKLVSSSIYHYKDKGFCKGNPLWCREIQSTILLTQNKNPDPNGQPDHHTVKIGKIYSYVLPYNAPDNVYIDWSDQVSQDVFDAMLFFTSLRKKLKKKNIKVGRAMWIDSVKLYEEFRGHDYSIKAVALLIAAEQVETPFLLAAPMDGLPLDDPSKIESIRSLRKHWSKLGFIRAGRGYWMYAPEWVPYACGFDPFFNEQRDDACQTGY